MALASGTRLGTYEITGALGAGGMGEVYRATDTDLKREVAIKILPPAFASDTDRIARFQREAEALAALNHPNIAQIYGLERSGETTALAMELVEGPTLADRIAEGPIPSDEALDIALQIADALEAAHEQNIVHRDLKPANIKLKPNGTIKVLDFGIATAPESAVVTSGRRSPTLLTPALTEAGVLLGTAAYMSPEQARGRAVDRRADIWAFGCVLYEMLTGQPAFGGEDVTTTLARVLEREANTTALPVTLPSAVRHTIELCLQKDIRKRVRDIGDVKLALEGAFESRPSDAASHDTTARPFGRRALPLVAAVLVTGLVATLIGWSLRPAVQPRPVNRFYYDFPKDQTLRNTALPIIALSPDGRRFVYNAASGLYVRSMGELEARLITGTEEQLATPFFSPDGQSVAYWAGRAGVGSGPLKRIAISGGAAVVIADGLATLLGASWGSDGTILYGQGTGIFRVSANGGKPKLVIPTKDGESLYGPELLPDGDSVLFSATKTGNWDQSQIVAQSLSTGKRTVLVKRGSDAHYVAGRLIYALGDGIFGIAFDPKSLTTSGGPVPLVQDVMRSPFSISATANYAVSNDGTLVYVSGSAVPIPRSTLVWVDRQGHEEPLGTECNCEDVSLSPDGMHVALAAFGQNKGGKGGEEDIWVWSIASHAFTRLTFEPGTQGAPVWSPDGKRIAYLSLPQSIFVRQADGTGSAEQLLKGSSNSLPQPYGWTLDGKLIFSDSSRGTSDIGVLGTTGDRKPQWLLTTKFNTRRTAMSPDEHWLAYDSDETGRDEIFVRPYPSVQSGKWQISADGGEEPRWSRDGRTLFFLGPKSLKAASIKSGASFAFDPPKAVLDRGNYFFSGTSEEYDVSPDGQRFLLLKPATTADTPTTRIVVVQNWLQRLERLVPTH